MGKATTALAEGLMKKIAGTGEIDLPVSERSFAYLGLYLTSTVFNFYRDGL